MDFVMQTHQHNQIREDLLAAIGEIVVLDAIELRSDRACATGRWLYGPAQKRWAGHHAYLHCLEAHREAHAAAAQVADLINADNQAEAKRKLRNGSRFALALADLTVAFRRMRQAEDARKD